MKHYEKLKNIRKGMNLTVNDVQERGAAILGPKKTISTATITRIESGKPHKFSSLLKLCFILGIELKDLYKGTELEDCLVITREDRTGGFVFDKKTSSQIINSPNQGFLAQEFVLLPGGKVPLDNAPRDKEKHEKFVYVVSGIADCVVAGQRYILKVGNTISFDSTKEHYFENQTKAKCKFVVIENPGRY